MKECVKIIGPCSKWIDGEGWVTMVPVDSIENAGYHKLSEDSVVLSKEEWASLQGKAWASVFKDAEILQLKEELKQAHKEVAEKYFNAVIEMLKEVKQFETIDVKDLVFLHEKNKEIAKQYDMEIKE